ncbi:hypothetical protein [Burkholderia humptydooensis]|nr:hypothetical protein [Burkholderia humptydooensis]
MRELIAFEIDAVSGAAPLVAPPNVNGVSTPKQIAPGASNAGSAYGAHNGLSSSTSDGSVSVSISGTDVFGVGKVAGYAEKAYEYTVDTVNQYYNSSSSSS